MSPRRHEPVIPPLADRQRPGLSETLTGPRAPNRCQRCGNPHTKAAPLTRWLEHDAWDKLPPPASRHIVVLCSRCSTAVIDAHPRMYKALWPNEPYAGCMSICLPCPFRDGVDCAHPTAQRNGGVGVVVAIAPPGYAHLNYGGGRGEFRHVFNSPAYDCSGLPMIPAEVADVG